MKNRYIIAITYCGDTQYRKLVPSVTKKEAEEILEELYDNDTIGAELFTLYYEDGQTGELTIIAEFEN